MAGNSVSKAATTKRAGMRGAINEGGASPASGSEPAKLSENDLERITHDLGSIIGLICSISKLTKNMASDEYTVGIEALCEKAGFLADRCAEAVGYPAMYGSWEGWAQLERPAAEATGEARHA